ncbi:gp16 family protein [Arsenophonus sp. PmNCSU2021_1]|uniref:gp16 family protein n=1 Tax=Arsenophonus sp. PmNCSU2021_1 TaxID=3118989 RepID=UPI002FF3D126
MNRATLIKLIHVARRELQLDEETYRAALMKVCADKTSCREMTVPELVRVLHAFQQKGFTVRSKPVLRGVKPASPVAKILAIWQTMHRQGFVQSGDEAALNAWITRTTARENGGLGVAQLAWLNQDNALAVKVLESLKRWHRRCMLATLPPGTPTESYPRVCQRYEAETRVSS